MPKYPYMALQIPGDAEGKPISTYLLKLCKSQMFFVKGLQRVCESGHGIVSGVEIVPQQKPILK